MRFITLIAKNVLHRPVRTVLTTVGLAIAIAAVVILVGISWNFEQSFLAIYRTKGIDLVVVRAGSSNQLSSSLDVKMGDRLRKIEGVAEVSPFAGRYRRLRGQEPGERARQRLDSRKHPVPRHPRDRRPALSRRAIDKAVMLGRVARHDARQEGRRPPPDRGRAVSRSWGSSRAIAGLKTAR